MGMYSRLRHGGFTFAMRVNLDQDESTEAIPLWERALTILREAPDEHQETINSISRSLQSAKESQVCEREIRTSTRRY